MHADGGEAWIDEDWPLEPGAHLASAVHAERHVAGFAGDGAVLRFALMYGPESSHTRAAVGLARCARITPVLGPDDAYAASLYTDDAAAAVVAALEVAPGTYDVGDDEPLRRTDVVAAQAAALGLRRLHRPPSALPSGSTAEAQTRSHRLPAARFRTASRWRRVTRRPAKAGRTSCASSTPGDAHVCRNLLGRCVARGAERAISASGRAAPAGLPSGAFTRSSCWGAA